MGARYDLLFFGSAFVFTRSGTVWTQQAKLVATDGAALDVFGTSVALRGDTAVVGAANHNDSGAAYVLVRSGTTWEDGPELAATDAAPGDVFGVAVGVSGNMLIAGAPRHGESGAESGAAYATSCSSGVAPALSCPAPITLECGSTGGLPATDPALLAWRAATSTSGGCTGVTVTDDAPILFAASCESDPRPVTVTFTATDDCLNLASCTSTVTVLDRAPPAVGASLTRGCLWPPDHRFVEVGTYGVADLCDPDASVFPMVCSDEAPASTEGAGGILHCPDAQVADGVIRLRAERSGRGADGGRVYTRVLVAATDACGNSASADLPSGTVRGCPGVACVPHDQNPASVQDGRCEAIQQPSTRDAMSCDPEASCR